MIEWFLILTVIAPVGAQQQYATRVVTRRFPADATQVDIYKATFGELPSHMRGGNVVFYDARPNLPAAGRAS